MDEIKVAVAQVADRLQHTLDDARAWLRALIVRRRARSLRRWMKSQHIKSPPRAVVRRGYDEKAILGGKTDDRFR